MRHRSAEQDDEPARERDPVDDAAHVAEAERQVARCRAITKPCSAGTAHARDEEEQDDAEHPEPEQLLAHPRAALAVVDRAERRVERAPERAREPDRGDERDDPDGGRGLLDPPQAVLQRRVGRVGNSRRRSATTDASTSSDSRIAPADEQRDEREREHGEQQVVGDHGRVPRQVLLVRLAPEAHERAGHRRALWRPRRRGGRGMRRAACASSGAWPPPPSPPSSAMPSG